MEALMESLMGNVDWAEIGWASWDTLVMVGMSLLFSVLIGLPIGVLLFLTGKRQLLEQPVAYAILSFIVNVLRSVPFIIHRPPTGESRRPPPGRCRSALP